MDKLFLRSLAFSEDAGTMFAWLESEAVSGKCLCFATHRHELRRLLSAALVGRITD
jgi:predicted aconitase